MAKWSIRVSKMPGGYDWAAYADDGGFVANDPWNEGVFITEESAIDAAIRKINAADVLKTARRITPSETYYDYEVNYG